MQEHDLLLAGNPASIELWREHTLGDTQSEHHRKDADGSGARSWHKQRPRRPPSNHEVSAEKVLQSFNTWGFKREQPSDRQSMLRLIERAIKTSQPLSFALYWGKGPRCALAQPDIQCLDFLSCLADRVKRAHAPGAAVNLIFTDTHAKHNGYPYSGIRAYFSEVRTAAQQRGFATIWLSQLTRAQVASMKFPGEAIVHQTTLATLIASAKKWYRGASSPEEGALAYYGMNMIEKRAVELAFPCSIFITFSGSKLRCLFPEHLPIFYMYALRRGTSVKPWFLPEEAMPCTETTCKCRRPLQSI
jgi:hypothetical protein